MTYDLRFECPDYDIRCDTCQGIELTNSVEGLIMLTLSTDPGNWMGHPGFDMKAFVGIRPNSTNRLLIQNTLKESLQWIVDLGNPIEVETEYRDGALCITINHAGERSICFDTVYGIDSIRIT